MLDFVHLHTHSDYSLLDGASSIKSLVKKAKSLGMRHLALTDHGNMFGALRFYNAAKAEGINPIIGCEFYVAPGSRLVKSGTEKGNKYHHLVLLAKNETGYRNLISLTSAGYTEGFYYKPRIDDELLASHADGLICLTACLAGEVPQKILSGDMNGALEKTGFYRELFGPENFYLEIQDHGIPEQRNVTRGLVELSKKTGLRLVATNDSHYTNRTDANAQDILICIGTNRKKNESNRMRFYDQEFYLKSADEMERIFHELPDALAATLEIAEKCNLTIPLPGPLLPEYAIPETFSSPEEYLRHLTYEGLAKRYNPVTDEIRERAEYELDVIIKMGFTGYFLIVQDFINWAKQHDIPVGPGRGSGAGSIVAYAIRITDIDPLRYKLLFERFLNPERISMPDFDVDFCFERRQEVIDYVTEKYGEDRVGQIITFGTLKAKAVIRDVARVLDLPYAEADQISKLIPAGPKVTLESALEEEPKLREYAEKGGVYGELIETARTLEGLSRHASTHAAGIVIGREPLTNYVPLYRDPKTGSISTQYTMDLLEDCGLVKMDFLGLKTLTLIKHTVDLIRRRGIEFDIDNIPEDDKATFELLGEGRSTCVFQFESSGMQGILKRAKPTRIEDLIALNALYRPGPMAYIDQFIDCKWGRKPIVYPLPELKRVLEETYGVIVYQEQVMEIARIVAGYSLGQADILRRAMGKKKVEVMAKEKANFIKGAEANGYTKKQAEDIFELLIPFAGYGFNKSHAAAYSVVAYKTAYLKANYPAEFMAANLTNEITAPDKLTEYISEARLMGIGILPPDINLSEMNFSVSDGKIVYGLLGIRNVGTAAVEEILCAREEAGGFTSFVQFLEAVDLKTVNRKVIETLIRSGVFDRFGETRATLFAGLDQAIEYAARKKESKLFGQVSLFESCEQEEFPPLELTKFPEWPELELLEHEKENLGFYFSGHPLDRYRTVWEKSATLDLTRADKANAEKSYTILGMVKSIRTIQTKNGKRMAFGELEDFKSSIELVIFPDIYEKFQPMLEENAVLGLIGKVDLSRGDPKFLVDELKRPDDLEEKGVPEIHIRLSSDLRSEEELYQLRAMLVEHPGGSPLFLHLPKRVSGTEVVIRASSQITVVSTDQFLSKIASDPRVSEVWRS
jgi:DNA polymerase-3 subunit alpha